MNVKKPTIDELEKSFIDEDKAKENPKTETTEVKTEIKPEVKLEVKTEDSIKEKPEVKIDDKPVERPVWTMPVAKAQKEKEKAIQKAIAEKESEFNTRLETQKQEYEKRLSESKPATSFDSRLESIATNHGLDINATKDLLNVFREELSQTIKTPEYPDMAEVKSLIEKQKIDQAKNQVNIEFEEQVLPLLRRDFPNANNEDISKIKNEISELAFTSKYNTYPISDIYAVNRNKWEIKNKFTAEDTGGRTATDVSLKSLSEEEAMKLSPQQYVKWMDLQGSNSQYVDL